MKGVKFINKSGGEIVLLITQDKNLKDSKDAVQVHIKDDKPTSFLNKNYKNAGTAFIYVFDKNSDAELWKGFVALDNDLMYNGIDVLAYNNAPIHFFKSTKKERSSYRYLLYLILLIILIVLIYLFYPSGLSFRSIL